MRIDRTVLFPVLAALWEIVAIFSLSHWNGLNLLNILGFAYLAIIPGLVVSLALRAGHALPFWTRLGQSIGLSLLLEMMWLLVCNTLLPHLGVPRPLDQIPLLIELSVMHVLIGIWGWHRLERLNYTVPPNMAGGYLRQGAAAFTPLILVALAVMGAISLNNGSTDALTMAMLVLACAYLFMLLALRARLADASIAWALYFISLSLLLMTSLRGWYVTGHDIQHEYLVFQMTVTHGRWDIASFRNPYNSCLSITILPTMFYGVLHIGSQYVYKILFQLIFAAVPVLVYQLMRLYISKAKALLAVVYFVSFPTFFTDMSFLNRQEIAFLFLALMLLFLLNKPIPLRGRRWLFTVFGIGIVLAHYSTTYALLLILVIAVGIRMTLGFARRMRWRWPFKYSAIAALRRQRQAAHVITIPMVIALILAAFVWNVLLTDTASSALSLVSQVTATLRTGSSAGTRSNDVSYSLLAPKAIEPQQLIDSYLKAATASKVSKAPKGTYYPQTVTSAYKITASPPDTLPLTRLGRFLATKVNVFALNYNLKQSSAKLLQLLVGIGLIYLLVVDSFGRSIDTDYFALSIASGLFMGMQLAVPFLSEAYGLLRAFQQALMLLGMYLVAGTFAVARIFRRWRRVSLAIPVVIALGFFLSSTGVLSELLGGYPAQLHLHNSGTYYGEYYMHEQELTADNWLVENVVHKDPHASVQTDLDTAIRLDSVTGYQAQNDITPAQIETYSYVLLGYNDTVNRQTFVSFDGNTIAYKYPVQFLDNNKSLIYNNGSAEIYH